MLMCEGFCQIYQTINKTFHMILYYKLLNLLIIKIYVKGVKGVKGYF